jgi:hypothetical protein
MPEPDCELPPQSVVKAIADLQGWASTVAAQTTDQDPAQKARDLIHISRQLLELAGACISAAKTLQEMACDLDQRLQKSSE